MENTLAATFLKWNIKKKNMLPITGSVWCSLSFFWTAESLRQMCREKQWTVSSIFCLINPEFIQVALNPELHKVFWTIPHSAIESRGQRECKISFTFINFWRKHQITNPFISAHTAEKQNETTMATTRPAPAWHYQKILVRFLIQPLLRAPLSLLGSLTLPVGETIYKKMEEPLIRTF